MKRIFGPIVALPLLALSGCFSLSRDTPPLERYVLGGAAEEGAASPRDPAGLTIGVRRLDLAPYLATPAVVIRRGAHQIVHSEFHRWGEDPGDGINRAVARYLASEPTVRAVDVAPWPMQSRHDYLVQLHVSRFEGVAPEEPSAIGGEVHMFTSWEIIRAQDGAVVARGVTDFRQGGWRVGDYGGLVTVLDRGLSGLARDLATCVEDLVSLTPATSEDGEGMPAGAPAMACVSRTV